MKKVYLVSFFIFALVNVFGQTPVPMSSQPGLTYTEDFADIANWTNGFAGGIGANRWGSVPINATGTIPDGVKITTSTATFTTTTTGGVQRGSSQTVPTTSILLLATGATSNTASDAIDIFLDYTGVNAGTLSFDWARVNNGTGDRGGSIKIYTSINGTTFTELIAAAVNNAINNGGTASGSITTVALPATFNNVSTARIRFYYFNGTTIGTTGSRPKISIDNLVVTASVSATPTISTSVSSLSGFLSTVSVPSAEQTYNVDGSNLTANIVITPPPGFQISTGTGGGFVPTNPINLAPTAGTVASTPIYVRMNSATLGSNTGNITHTSTGATQKDVALSGKVLAAEPTVQSTITIGAVTNSTVVVNFSGGNGTRRILLAKLATPVSSDPLDGTTYTANANFGSGTLIFAGNYVVYDGVGNTQLVTGLTAGATYHFAIYEYNNGGVAGAENYLIPGGPGNATLLTYSVPYVWIGLNADWQVAANWAPARLFPATNDSLLFTSASVNDVITNVPTQTVGYIGASLLTGTTLQAAASGNTLTVGNLTGTDFFVDAGSFFNINTANALTFNLVTGATASISGNMTFAAGAHKLTAADPGAITFNNGAVFLAGTLFTGNAFGPTPTATAYSVIFASGSTYRYTTGGNPFALTAPASVVVFQPGSLYKHESILNPSVSGRNYANFELDAPALTPIIAPGAGLLTMDNLTITNGSISFGLTTGGFDLKGNIVVTSGDTLRFAPTSAGMLTFKGTSAQSISNAGTLTFGANQNVTINNAAGLTLNTPVTLSKVLTFTSGLINTSTANLLTLTAAASVTGAGNASFVNGPVSKIGNSAFLFPVGKTNCGPSGTVNGYVALSISAPALATDQFTAEYVHSSAKALGTISNVGINHVSACDYWKLDKISAAPATVDITLNWDDPLNNCTTASPYINNLATVIIAHFNGTSWDNFGGLGTAGPLTTTGSVTWTGVSTFSPFSIASSSFLNPLPITINYFNGIRNNGNHLLNWKLTCVSTPSATIEMERSTDGRNYSSIYSIFATAVRCQQPFNYTDNQPAKGINYYRLKMTDADGKITYSTIVTLINAVKGIDVMNIAPNPVVNSAFNLKVSAAAKTQMEIVVTDMQGRILQKQSVSLIAGFNSIPMNVKNLAAGTYQLVGNTEDGKTKVLRFVIQ